jgi:hypothetical protein
MLHRNRCASWTVNKGHARKINIVQIIVHCTPHDLPDSVEAGHSPFVPAPDHPAIASKRVPPQAKSGLLPIHAYGLATQSRAGQRRPSC